MLRLKVLRQIRALGLFSVTVATSFVFYVLPYDAEEIDLPHISYAKVYDANWEADRVAQHARSIAFTVALGIFVLKATSTELHPHYNRHSKLR